MYFLELLVTILEDSKNSIWTHRFWKASQTPTTKLLNSTSQSVFALSLQNYPRKAEKNEKIPISSGLWFPKRSISRTVFEFCIQNCKNVFDKNHFDVCFVRFPSKFQKIKRNETPKKFHLWIVRNCKKPQKNTFASRSFLGINYCKFRKSKNIQFQRNVFEKQPKCWCKTFTNPTFPNWF